MEGDVAVFESHVTGHHEFRSKNYWAYDLRPGLLAYAYLHGRPPQEQYHIIPPMGIVHVKWGSFILDASAILVSLAPSLQGLEGF